MKKKVIDIYDTSLTMGQAKDDISELAYECETIEALGSWIVAVATIFTGRDLLEMLDVYVSEYTRISGEAPRKELCRMYYSLSPMKG